MSADMKALRGRGKPGPRTEIRGVPINQVADRIIAEMAEPKDSLRSKFSELLAGGNDWNDAMTPAEIGIYFGKGDSYGRVMLQRLIAEIGKRAR